MTAGSRSFDKKRAGKIYVCIVILRSEHPSPACISHFKISTSFTKKKKREKESYCNFFACAASP
jgi:hypothetical protein